MIATLLMLGLKSLLVAAVALAALRLTRRRSAAERSTIAHLGLFALVALPLASLSLPALSIALPAALSPPMQQIDLPMDRPTQTAAAGDLPATTPGHLQLSPQSVAPLAQSPSVGERAAFLARYAYALPVLALLGLTLVALLRLVALRSRAQVVIEPLWLGALARAQRRMNFKNGTALLASTELQSPISWGLMRPTIVVNEEALLAGDRAEAIIAHELAHVIQFDWAKLMLARVATALFWFNPLAWLLAREAHQLREEAADDAVLAANIAGTDYAELLVGIARHERNGLLLGAHGVAPSRDSLRRRVKRVLDSAPARGRSGGSWVAGFTAGMTVMAVPLAAVTFGPASASETPAAAPAAAEAKAEPAPKSWSTRASDAPNQILAEPHHLFRGDRRALAAAVNGLPDERAPNRAVDIDRDEANNGHDDNLALVPGTIEWASAWRKFGNEIGARYAQAFGAGPVPAAGPAPAARPAPQPNGFDFNFDFDYPDASAKYAKNAGRRPDTDAMFGISDEYRREIASAGFPSPSRTELFQAKSAGLNAESIAQLRAAGVGGGLGNFAWARNAGLSADYLQSLRAVGLSGSVSQYVQARSVGLTADYVRSLVDAGLKGSLHDFTRARATGLSASYVREMAALGVDASFDDYRQMRALGITSAYVQALHDNGNGVTDPRRLIELKTHGYRQRDRSGSDP